MPRIAYIEKNFHGSSQRIIDIEDEMMTVSLDRYRTPGVRVFSGFDRGKAVAKVIKEEYGEDVTIEVPDDVFCVAGSFWRGFSSVLPNAKVPARY